MKSKLNVLDVIGFFFLATLSSSVLASAYPAWQDGGTYSAGSIVSYNGHDYKAIVNQTDYAGAGWNPAGTPTLWLDLGLDSGTLSNSGYPVWQDGSTYPAGAVIYYNGRIYKSRQQQTDYLGAGWNPAAAASLWLDMGVATPQDPLLTNVSVNFAGGNANTTQFNWASTGTLPLTLSAIPSYTIIVTNPGAVPPPPAKLYSPSFVWQIWDNGQEIYSTNQFGVTAALTYVGCDPTPTSPPDACTRKGNFNGSRWLFLKAGVHNLALRMCDTSSGKCYITAPASYTVANSAVVLPAPKKPVLKVTSPLLRSTPYVFAGGFSDTTPFTADKSQLADGAQISAEKSNGIVNMYWVFNANQVTQPVTKSVVVNQVSGYDQSTTGTFLLNYVAPFMPPGSSFNFVLSVCNNQGTQCTTADPVAASIP